MATLIQLFQAGGPIMWAILACSVIALFIFIGKWFQFHRAQVNVGELVAGLVNVLRRDGFIEAITLCDNTPGPVARLLGSAITAYQNDDDIRQALRDRSLTEVPALESRLNVLATIAYVAPLLGLLGTVVGLFGTFQIVSQEAVTLANLSSGVYSALICTAAGLCVAIPCHIAYNYLLSRVNYFCIEMEKASSEIMYFFQHHEKQQSVAETTDDKR